MLGAYFSVSDQLFKCCHAFILKGHVMKTNQIAQEIFSTIEVKNGLTL